MAERARETHESHPLRRALRALEVAAHHLEPAREVEAGRPVVLTSEDAQSALWRIERAAQYIREALL